MAGRRRSGMFGSGGAARKQTAGAREEARTSGPTPRRRKGCEGDARQHAGAEMCSVVLRRCGVQRAASKIRCVGASDTVLEVIFMPLGFTPDYQPYACNLVITGSYFLALARSAAVCHNVQSMQNAGVACRCECSAPKPSPLQPAERAHHAQRAKHSSSSQHPPPPSAPPTGNRRTPQS